MATPPRQEVVICLLAGMAMLMPVVPARGGVSLYLTCEDHVGLEGIEVLAVTVLAANPAQTTNAAPPHVGLRVEQVLEGRTSQRYVKALWSPPPSPLSMSDTDPP